MDRIEYFSRDIRRRVKELELPEDISKTPDVEELIGESPDVIPSELRPPEFRNQRWRDPDYYMINILKK